MSSEPRDTPGAGAASPPSPPPHRKDAENTLVQAVAELMVGIEKSIRTLVQFGPEHQNFTTVVGRTYKHLDGVLAQEEVLSLGIEPFRITYTDTVVLEDFEIDKSLCYKLYQDGVRVLRLLRGLSLKEFSELLSILAIDFRNPQYLDEDTITLMWKRDLERIQCDVVEVLFEEDEQRTITYEGVVSGLTASTDLVSAHPPRGGHREDIDSLTFDRIELDSAKIEAVFRSLDTPDLLEQKVYGLSEHDREQLAKATHSLDAGQAHKLMHVFIYHIAELRPDKRIDLYLSRLVDQLLEQRKLKELVAILVLLQQFSNAFQGRKQELLRSFLAEATLAVIEGERRTAILSLLNDQTIETQEKHYLLGLLSTNPRLLPTLIDLIEELRQPALRRAVADLLLPHLRRDFSLLTGKLSAKTSTLLASEALYLFEKLPFVTYRRLLPTLLSHPDPFIRRALLTLVENNASEECLALVVPLLEDADREVRLALLKLLKKRSSTQCHELLWQQLERGVLYERDDRERRLVLGLLAADETRHPQLRDFFLSRKLIGSSGVLETRIRLAEALAASTLPDKVAMLKEVAGRRLENKDLKIVCENLLRTIDHV